MGLVGKQAVDLLRSRGVADRLPERPLRLFDRAIEVAVDEMDRAFMHAGEGVDGGGAHGDPGPARQP